MTPFISTSNVSIRTALIKFAIIVASPLVTTSANPVAILANAEAIVFTTLVMGPTIDSRNALIPPRPFSDTISRILFPASTSVLPAWPNTLSNIVTALSITFEFLTTSSTLTRKSPIAAVTESIPPDQPVQSSITCDKPAPNLNITSSPISMIENRPSNVR